MKRILLVTLCALPIFVHADWIKGGDLRTLYPDVTTDEIIKKHDREFLIPFKSSKTGFDICGFDGTSSYYCSLRFKDGKVDFIVKLFQKMWDNGGKLYLILKDEDGFLIKRIASNSIGPGFIGEEFGQFNVSWEEFSKYKYFDIELRA